MKEFVDEFVAEPKPRLELYEDAEPIFDKFGVESKIDANLGRKVWLKSGGYLIIDQSEALTAIDVNTGRYVGKHDLEETVLRTNLEAVKEVVYQLRFRNIGGLIIIDLIDMEPAENREKVYRALQEALRGDKAKTNILKISELGLVEMTRKRTRESLVQMLCEPCPHCEGKGYVLSEESVAFKVLREIRKAVPRFAGREIEVTVQRRVAEQLLGPARESLRAVEAGARPRDRDPGPSGHPPGAVRDPRPGPGRAGDARPALAARQGGRRGAGRGQRRLRGARRGPAGGRPGAPRGDERARGWTQRAVAAPQLVDSEGEFPILPGSEEPREEH